MSSSYNEAEKFVTNKIKLVDATASSITITWPAYKIPTSTTPTTVTGISSNSRNSSKTGGSVGDSFGGNSPSSSSTDSNNFSSQKQKSTVKYTLQYRCSDEIDFVTLSSSLSGTTIKKKNLSAGKSPFFFRVRPNVDPPQIPDSSCSTSTSSRSVPKPLAMKTPTWMSNLCPYRLTTIHEESLRMQPPHVDGDVGNHSITIRWEPYEPHFLRERDVEGYELQMREADEGGKIWQTVSHCLKGLEARKRNLREGAKYQFRVAPAKRFGGLVQFSSPSEEVCSVSLSTGMKDLFKGLPYKCFLQGPESTHISFDVAISNKIVLLYASAGWNHVCRVYTPQLMGFYKNHKTEVDIVFLSCDNNSEEFRTYFQTMPWKAVPYECKLREKLLAWISIKTIPRLVVLNSKGKILVDNAADGVLDAKAWRTNPNF